MSSLKEKAKTLLQVIKEKCPLIYSMYCKDCTGECEFEHTEYFAGKWVKVEDVEKELLELKQKLQQLIEEILSCIDCEHYLGDEKGNGHCSLAEQQHIESLHCLKDKFLNDLPKKFEELLKEVNVDGT